MKKALITGIAGQDGVYLAEYRLGKRCDAHHNSIPSELLLYCGDLADSSNLTRFLSEVKLSEVHNLGA